ncbi:hypothetical protein FDW95_04080, partial [Citrobacter sp. wls718]
MMKTYIFSFFLLFYSYTSWAESTTWKDECIGYYQLQLPDNLEVGLYPAENINTKDLPIDAIFGEYHQYRRGNINNPYSHFYYGKHRVLVSKNNVVSFNKYKDDVGEDLSYFNHKYNTIQYSHDVFFLSYDESYSLYIYKKNRLYQFMKGHDDIRLRTETKYLSSESGILSFLEHFQTRELYDIPSEKGFCLPYGFIANDSGAEDRDMAVTYRMNNHPDVMIVFQDASYQLPYKVPLNSDLTPVKNYDAKDYA